MNKNKYGKQVIKWVIKCAKKSGQKRLLLVLCSGILAGANSGCGMLLEDIASMVNTEEEIPQQEQNIWLEETIWSEESIWQEETFSSEDMNLQDIPYVITGSNEISVIAERVMPAVVSINCICQWESTSILGRSRSYEVQSDGSGIIIGQNNTELLIVTNHHVVSGATVINVTFIDNELAEAHIKGIDIENDLAVIAVEMEEISNSTKKEIAIGTLGDSDSLKVGEGVIAIGNALGYGQSVTVGYISAVNREIQTDAETTTTLIQTDAAINPGNSGGALLNMQGEIIGINSAKIAIEEVEGMGYAIPITKTWGIIEELMMQKTRILVEEERRGYLGIQGKNVDSSRFRLFSTPQGVQINKLAPDGTAIVFGLREKDIITKFNGQPVMSIEELSELMNYYEIGEYVDVTVWSLQNGEYIERQVMVMLGGKPKGREKDNIL